MRLPQFYKIEQGKENKLWIKRIHLWVDGTWDERGGHSVTMPMTTYEDIRKEMNKLRRKSALEKIKP